MANEAVEKLADALRELHRELLEIARAEYDRTRGAPTPPGRFLQALIEDPALQWLRPLSVLIVELDVIAEGEPLAASDRERIAREVDSLLTPTAATELGRRYETILQERPEVVVAHGRVRAAAEWLRRAPS